MDRGGLEPIPDPPILPEQIPWYDMLSQEMRRLRMTVIPPIESFVDEPRDETIFIDKWYTPLGMPLPRPNLPIALFPFRKEPEEILDENITIDKWYTQLPYEFRRIVLPTALVPFAERGDEPRQETITLDKWWTPLSVEFRRFLWRWNPMERPGLLPIPDDPGFPPPKWDVPFGKPVLPKPFLLIYWPFQEWFATLPPVLTIPCDVQRGRPDSSISPRSRVDAGDHLCPTRPDQSVTIPGRAIPCADER
jgi:hypothetical protein